jgi:ribonuclease PH
MLYSRAQSGYRRTTLIRTDGRKVDELRETRIIPGAQAYAEGSVIVETGQTKVLCAATIEDGVPRFLKGTGQGWITAEYAMLPRATLTRTSRERGSSGLKGRTQEIQRLIGRSLRASTDLDALGERTLTVDCDVLQADGGTRTASITGAYVAVYQAMRGLVKARKLKAMPLKCAVAATSVGVFGDDVLLDLNYEEDYRAQVDFNLVMTDQGEFVEVQGTAEGGAFSRASLNKVIDAAEAGITKLFSIQNEVIESL